MLLDVLDERSAVGRLLVEDRHLVAADPLEQIRHGSLPDLVASVHEKHASRALRDRGHRHRSVGPLGCELRCQGGGVLELGADRRGRRELGADGGVVGGRFGHGLIVGSLVDGLIGGGMVDGLIGGGLVDGLIGWCLADGLIGGCLCRLLLVFQPLLQGDQEVDGSPRAGGVALAFDLPGLSWGTVEAVPLKLSDSCDPSKMCPSVRTVSSIQ